MAKLADKAFTSVYVSQSLMSEGQRVSRIGRFMHEPYMYIYIYL